MARPKIPRGKVITALNPDLKGPLQRGAKSEITFSDLVIISTQLKKFKKLFPEDYKRRACFPCVKVRT